MTTRKPFTTHPSAEVVLDLEDRPVEDFTSALDDDGEYPYLMSHYRVSTHALARDDGSDFTLPVVYKDGAFEAFVDLDLLADLPPHEEDCLPGVLLTSMQNAKDKDGDGHPVPSRISLWADAYAAYWAEVADKAAASKVAPQQEVEGADMSAPQPAKHFEEDVPIGTVEAPVQRPAQAVEGPLELLPVVAEHRKKIFNKYVSLGMTVLDAYLTGKLSLSAFAEQLQAAFDHENNARRISGIVVDEVRRDRIVLNLHCREAQGRASTSHKVHITASLFEFDVRVTGRKKYPHQIEVCEFIQEQLINVLDQHV